MKSYKLADLSIPKRHQLLLSGVGPRPIAFASTINLAGQINLSPFSFFNLFSTNPPVAIFSPARRGYDGSKKDTLLNVLEVPEVAISMVNYAMVQQMSLASNEYDRGINEFKKAGLTMGVSQTIRPPYVAESPFVLECRVKDVIELGEEGSAGNLVLCHIDLLHVREDLVDQSDNLNTTQVDLVARMGGNWYCRAFGKALFEVTKPSRNLAIGFDSLPEHVLRSPHLTANELARLASSVRLPTDEEMQEVRVMLASYPKHDTHNLSAELQRVIHEQIKNLLATDNLEKALSLAFVAKDFLQSL